MNNRGALYGLLAVVAAGWLVYLLAPILTPFLTAALLAYICDPLADRLERWKLSRTVAVVVIFLALTTGLVLLVLVLAPLIQTQVITFMQKAPGYVDWLQNSLAPTLQESLGIDAAALDLSVLKQRALENWREIGSWVGLVLASMTRSGLGLALWLLNAVLVPVVMFYLLRDWDDIVARAHDLVPRRHRLTVGGLARDIDAVLANFFRGQLTVMLALGLFYSVGLWVMGLDLAVPIGLGAGLVSFVPYLGVIVGLVVAGAAAALQFKELLPVLGVLAVFGVGQMLEGMILTPRLVGGRIGLHPVAVIFAVMAGGQLFGFFGVLLALPLAAAVMVWMRHLHGRYTESGLYRDRPEQ
jgi:predicted PurR-regulated permease PerM